MVTLKSGSRVAGGTRVASHLQSTTILVPRVVPVWDCSGRGDPVRTRRLGEFSRDGVEPPSGASRGDKS